MKAIRSWSHFRAHAPGGYFVGPSYVAWSPAPDFTGLAFFGRMSDSELHQALSLWEEPGPGGLEPTFDFFFEGRWGESSGPACYDLIHEWFTARGGSISRRVRRQAYAKPPGTCGAMFRGLLSLTDAGVPTSVVDDRDEALAWLGRPEMASAAELVERAGQDIVEHSPVVARLRALVSASGSQLSIATAGRELGMTPRSLQRHLRAAGTGFRVELERAKQVG